ncbi:MAG: recombination regulator RecX [Victivallales bacterium]|nr:recombination regulator RecX [Victivallales bacterium]MCF7888715.1 recombination regulator RecX [Victivallales bacterium]
MQITIYKIEKKGKYYYLRTNDSDKTLKILSEVCEEYFLRAGKRLDSVKLQEILKKNEYRLCMNTALDILKRRIHSEYELKIKLSKKFRKYYVDEVIDKCHELNLLDDNYYTECYIQELKNRGCGSFKIFLALKQKGIDQELINKFKDIISNKNEEEERALELSEKKLNMLKNIPEEKKKNKLFRYLISKGFSYETAYTVLKKVMDE